MMVKLNESERQHPSLREDQKTPLLTTVPKLLDEAKKKHVFKIMLSGHASKIPRNEKAAEGILL